MEEHAFSTVPKDSIFYPFCKLIKWYFLFDKNSSIITTENACITNNRHIPKSCIAKNTKVISQSFCTIHLQVWS